MNRDVCEHFSPVDLPCDKCEKPTLREAAQAVLDRWDSPRWEWHQGPTAALMADLRAALAEPVQEPVQGPVAWTPVDKALPKSGVKVLACYRNRLGNLRRIRAQWIAAKTQEADSDDAEACFEYDEATDTYYTTEGWYECIDNWGDYSSVAVCEGDVTHWMPLPPDPYTAPPQRKPLTEEEIDELAMDEDGLPNSHLEFARAIERAHGIGEKE